MSITLFNYHLFFFIYLNLCLSMSIILFSSIIASEVALIGLPNKSNSTLFWSNTFSTLLILLLLRSTFFSFFMLRRNRGILKNVFFQRSRKVRDSRFMILKDTFSMKLQLRINTLRVVNLQTNSGNNDNLFLLKFKVSRRGKRYQSCWFNNCICSSIRLEFARFNSFMALKL